MTSEDFIDLIDRSIKNAEEGKSKLTSAELSIDGGSSAKIRHFLNNVCSVASLRYLEVGLWKGSTFCSALKDNIVDAVGIDHWSFFGGREEFNKNFASRVGKNVVTVIDHDLYTLDIREIPGDRQVYFYDGDHTEKGHRNAFLHIDSALSETFVAIIDDWFHGADGAKVRMGTEQAFWELDYEILREWTLGKDGIVEGDKDDWWCGLKVFLTKKPGNPRRLVEYLNQKHGERR